MKLLAMSFDRVCARSIPRFQTGRWTKMIPVQKRIAGGFLLGTMLSDALAGIEINDRNASEFMQKYGKRLSKMRSRMLQPMFKFRVACCLAATIQIDRIMNVLFAESAEDRKPDDEREPGSEEDWLLDRTPSYRIQLCIYREAADVWASLKSFFCCSDTVSSFEVAALFWPAGDDVKQRDTAVVQDRGYIVNV